ncbi:MAG: alpha/beta hydrolase [Deltaproteobacteria bacterium]|nr:alpha/beta hydrolase [Deltaproteobacteria bacterium]
MKLSELPEKPPRPHTYFDLPSRFVDVPRPDSARPIRIHYKEAGAGDPLLLVHGLMTSSYSFRYLIPLLAPHGRVVVPDLPGAGESDAPTDLSMAPDSVAEVLLSFIAALALGPTHVVGNSLGGYESLWLATNHRDQVRRLTIIHAPGFPHTKLRAMQLAMAIPGSATVFRRLVTKNPEAFVAKNVHYHDPRTMSLEEARTYGAIFRDTARTEVFRRILRESVAPAKMKELHARIRAMRANGEALPPTRLLWARHDVMVPATFGEKYKALLPDADLVWFDDVSHFMHVDEPEKVASAILSSVRQK